MPSRRQRPESQHNDPANRPAMLDLWIQEPPNRLVRLGLPHMEPHMEPYTLTSPYTHYHAATQQSVVSNSSMASPVSLHQHQHQHQHRQHDALGTPSLVYATTEATPTESSLNTGFASYLPGVPLLEDHNGVLEQQQQQQPYAATHAHAPEYSCVFWFLNCDMAFTSFPTWETHCLSHFRGEEPPRHATCPLCEWSASRDDGNTAWTAKMAHLASAHLERGHGLASSRPDFALFKHLWNKRLIGEYDLKELMGANSYHYRNNGGQASGRAHQHLVTPGSGSRRERHGGGRRMQHVGPW